MVILNNVGLHYLITDHHAHQKKLAVFSRHYSHILCLSLRAGPVGKPFNYFGFAAAVAVVVTVVGGDTGVSDLGKASSKSDFLNRESSPK